MTFAILYLRPDGWWEAGQGWEDRAHAEADGKKELGEREHKVVEVGSEEHLNAYVEEGVRVRDS